MELMEQLKSALAEAAMCTSVVNIGNIVLVAAFHAAGNGQTCGRRRGANTRTSDEGGRWSNQDNGASNATETRKT